MRPGIIAALSLLSVAAGIATGEAIYRSEICRDAIGRCCGRGHLLALINGRGIYQDELGREIVAEQYFADGKSPSVSDAELKKRLIANGNLRHLCLREPASATEWHRELGLLQDQFGDDKTWQKRLQESDFSLGRLQRSLEENLRGRRWIEHSLSNGSGVDEQTLRGYYAQHLVAFMQPLRMRTSHIFLAAPPGISPAIVDAKKKLIDSLADRLRGGEEFNSLVWEASEDEATKPRGGDLGYFSESRIPHDFFSAVAQLKIGEPPKVIRSTLGFHIVKLTEIKPPRQMSLEEARSEIVALFENARRRQTVENLAARCRGSSALRGRWFWN
jgi:parvulin-like peptidyl-prolyl isomerase